MGEKALNNNGYEWGEEYDGSDNLNDGNMGICKLNVCVLIYSNEMKNSNQW